MTESLGEFKYEFGIQYEHVKSGWVVADRFGHLNQVMSNGQTWSQYQDDEAKKADTQRKLWDEQAKGFQSTSPTQSNTSSVIVVAGVIAVAGVLFLASR